jgi:hypothetical protein
MQPDANGRYCGSCAQTVIDFTTWELGDIAAYLKKNTGQHTCGRFLISQLNQPLDVSALVPRVISWRTDGWRKVAALIIICFALTSCMGKAADNNQDTERVQVMGDFSIPGADTLQKIEKKAIPPTAKSKAVRHSKPCVKGIGPNEPNFSTTMGAPLLESPREIVPVRTEVPKFQPTIGPEEDDAKQEYKEE